ncbi:response regulator transcription factor [Planococcus soli]|uniref:response regulator transcription factor n=1 Tax=Planococcus soli TaxID=2666072 RepID=UPI00115C852B|nr:response regulator transcription factor [Planococcus soli]
MGKTILIVDDDRDIAGLAEIYLRNEGYDVQQAQDGLEALAVIERASIDLIVLDVMMPRMDGLEFCRQVRATSQVPILMLSAKVQDMDKITGLMTGADDYMTKPFNPLELNARVKGLLRRASYSLPDKEQESIQIHSWKIDKKGHGVSIHGKEIKLTSSEFDILYLLAKNQGSVFSSEEIFRRLWQEDSIGSNKTVMVHIKNLRDKMQAASPGEALVQTVWGVGYKIEKSH